MSNPFKKLFEYLEDDKTPNMMRGLVVMFMMIGIVILLVAVLSIIAGKPL